MTYYIIAFHDKSTSLSRDGVTLVQGFVSLQDPVGKASTLQECSTLHLHLLSQFITSRGLTIRFCSFTCQSGEQSIYINFRLETPLMYGSVGLGEYSLIPENPDYLMHYFVAQGLDKGP